MGLRQDSRARRREARLRPDLPPWTFAVPASAWVSTGAAYAQGWLLAGTGLLVVATLATAAYAVLQFLQVAAAWDVWRSSRPQPISSPETHK